MEWYLTVWRKYAVFTGRARRREFWVFTLANFLVSFIVAGVDSAVLGSPLDTLGLLSALYGLAVIIPSLAVTVRRLHDTDRSGWWWFIAFVPLVGGVILLVFLVLDGTAGENRFGPDPKGRTA